MKKDITRAIINTTVDRGLREIDEDPRRSIRKLADLGHHFNNGRFMQNIYDIFQDLLKNDDSPYYSAIEHLLQHTSRKNLKDCGINIGYNSLTKGAKTIRSIKSKKGYLVPWNIIIRLDSTSKDNLVPADIFNIISQGKSLGIYTYMLRLENNLDYLSEVTRLMNAHDDCSFLVFLPDCELSDEAAEKLKPCSNSICFFHASGECCDANALLLRRQKSWYGTYEYYDDSNINSILTNDTAWDYISQESIFLMLISKDGSSLDLIKKQNANVKQTRMAPYAPILPFDLYGDALLIEKLVNEDSCFFEILADGSFYTDRGSFPKKEGIPNLETTFSSIFKI